MNPTIQPWLEADAKVAEWFSFVAKRTKNTARNYSRLLWLYWKNNQRFIRAAIVLGAISEFMPPTGKWNSLNPRENNPQEPLSLIQKRLEPSR